MKEKLRSKKLILRILGVCIVLIAIVIIFLPIYKVNKTVEMLGVKETITAKFSVWQMIIQDKISLDSTSALGKFDGVNSVGIASLLGGKTTALVISVALVILLAAIVVFGGIILFSAMIDTLQCGVVKCLIFSFFSFLVFSASAVSILVEKTGYSYSPPIVYFIIICVVMLALYWVFEKFFDDIGAISAEIFIKKYKNENKKWFKMFTTDFMEFVANANIPVEFESFIRFVDVADRREEYEKDDEKEIDKEKDSKE